jgi:hypothetical protein
MNSSDLPQEIVDLGRVITNLSQGERELIDPLFRQVAESARRRRHILALVQEALSQLRLDMKYLMFDLEATRREREELRRQLEETGNDG